MDNLDDLKLRIEQIVAALQEINQIFKTEIEDLQKVVSFNQVKEIENFIERFKRKGLPVPPELMQLKLKLVSSYENHKEVLSVYNKFLESIHLVLSEATPKTAKTAPELKTSRPSRRKVPDYEKPLGSKGNSNLEDYLIPVIKLIWDGYNYKDAFRQIAITLDVRYNTVSSQCTRALGLTTDEFISRVNSKTIVALIEVKYPDRYHTIKAQLK